MLRIKLRYDDVEVMVQRFAPNVGKSGLFLPTKSLQAIGAEVKFELRLADETPVLVGLGRVKTARAPDPANPRATFGMGIELMRVTPQSRALILKMLERRRVLGLPETQLPTAEDIDAARQAPEHARDLASGPVVAPVVVAAPTVAPGEGLMTAPRRPTGPMAVPKILSVTPLAPEAPRKKRLAPSELAEAAAIATAAAPGLDDDVDVAAALARARVLAGGALDDELEALAHGSAVPVEVSIEGASAELARALGGAAVRRGWAPPPATAANEAPPEPAEMAPPTLPTVEAVEAAEPAAAAAPLEPAEPAPVEAAQPAPAAAPLEAAEPAPLEPIASSFSIATTAPIAAPEPIASSESLATTAPVAAPAPVDDPDATRDSPPAPEPPERDSAEAIAQDAFAAINAIGDDAAELAAAEAAVAADAEHDVIAAINAIAELDAPPVHLTEHIQPLHDLDLEDDVEHTEAGAIPGLGGFDPPPYDLGLADRLDAELASAEAEADADDLGLADAPVDLSLEEIDEFEILAEADAADEDLLHTEAEAAEAEAELDDPQPTGIGRRSELDFASRLDLGDESDADFAMPAHQSIDDLADADALDAPSEDFGLPEAQLDSAGQALAVFEDDPIDDPDEHHDRFARRIVQPIFEPEPSSSYTLAGIPSNDFELPVRPSPRPAPAALLGDAPVEDHELEHALEALDVELDDLSIPHAATELQRDSDKSRPTAALRPSALRRPEDDEVEIDFEDDD